MWLEIRIHIFTIPLSVAVAVAVTVPRAVEPESWKLRAES